MEYLNSGRMVGIRSMDKNTDGSNIFYVALIVLLFVLIPPVGFILIWKDSNITTGNKILLTGLSLVLVLILYAFLQDLIYGPMDIGPDISPDVYSKL